MKPEPWYDWIFFAIIGIPWVLGFIVLFLERGHERATYRYPLVERPRAFGVPDRRAVERP